MKWFKHFTDNHRGKSVQYMLDHGGYFAVFLYYTLYEMCAEKLDKFKDRSLAEVDCEFVFHRRVVESALRARPTTVRRVLDLGSECGLWTYSLNGELFKFNVPILLELLDYDSKKSRQDRARIAPGSRLESEPEPEPQSEPQSEPETYISRSEDLQPKIKFHRLAELWNEKTNGLPKIRTTSLDRNKRISSAWKKHTEEEWIEVLEKIQLSDFCHGRNEKAWVATLDWLIKPDTFFRVLEGKYDNRSPVTQTNSKKRESNLDALEEKWKNKKENL